MMPLAMDEMLQATGGRLLSGSPMPVEGISIDSRNAGEKDFFVALKGERFDGHDFVGEALAKCAGAVVSIPPVSPPSRKIILHVENTLKALQGVAHHIRKKFAPRVLAITGTNGKTTTKEMSASILSRRHRVHKNTGNLNNQVGLPLSLLDLEQDHEVAVLEMGASAPGDIRELCGIAAPDLGVLTNIGLAHIEGFKDIGAVRQAKMELLESVGSAAVNADDEFLMEGLSSYKGELLSFGMREDADVRAAGVDLRRRGSGFDLHALGESIHVGLKVSGAFNVYNALAAATAGLLFGMPLDAIRDGLEEFKGVPMRLEVKGFGGGTVISDVYNANPASMEEALKELLRLRDRRAVAVLGDMLELGSYSDAAHRRLGRWMSRFPIDILIAVGEEMRVAADEFEGLGGRAIRAGDADEAGRLLRDHFREGDTVLIKGSRSMKMENVLGAGEGHIKNAEGGGED
jgi:UDP-N-acetylmuramoyl-tripeptide--D-alanyl-D-alanine ligase